MKNISFIATILTISIILTSCTQRETYSVNSLGRMQSNQDDCVNYDYDADAELYDDLSRKAGKNPRGWRAAYTGFFEGMAHGSRKKSTLCRQKLLQEME